MFLCQFTKLSCFYACSKQRIIPIVQLFPPGSVLHHCLFLPIIATSNLSRVSETLLTQQVQLPPSAVIPANEYLLEAIGGILLQSNSGGVIVKGVGAMLIISLQFCCNEIILFYCLFRCFTVHHPPTGFHPISAIRRRRKIGSWNRYRHRAVFSYTLHSISSSSKKIQRRTVRCPSYDMQRFYR